MNNMLKSILTLTFAAAALAPAIHAEVYIYSNNVVDAGISMSFSANGIIAAGNQITFAGTNRFLTSAAFQIFNESTSGVTSTATLNLYNVSGNVLGSLLGSYTLSPGSYLGGAVATVTFSLPYLLAPNEIVWTLAFSDPNIDLNYFGPTPEIGSTDPTVAWWDYNNGSGPVRVNFPAGTESYNAVFGAEAQTPEPSTVVLTGLAMGLLAYYRRGRSNHTA